MMMPRLITRCMPYFIIAGAASDAGRTIRLTICLRDLELFRTPDGHRGSGVNPILHSYRCSGEKPIAVRAIFSVSVGPLA